MKKLSNSIFSFSLSTSFSFFLILFNVIRLREQESMRERESFSPVGANLNPWTGGRVPSALIPSPSLSHKKIEMLNLSPKIIREEGQPSPLVGFSNNQAPPDGVIGVGHNRIS